jgi:hypothetical protein
MMRSRSVKDPPISVDSSSIKVASRDKPASKASAVSRTLRSALRIASKDALSMSFSGIAGLEREVRVR